jgi:hypothetical protein
LLEHTKTECKNLPNDHKIYQTTIKSTKRP